MTESQYAIGQRDQAIPDAFCWSRFGTEAGETVDDILCRKEVERGANDGTFLWGIGNGIGPGVLELLRRTDEPEVLFSPIKGRPRPTDVQPWVVVRWTAARTLDGRRMALPDTFEVRGGSATERLSPRYAMVCRVSEPLRLANCGELDVACLRNLVSGKPVGASQVTAVVSRATDEVESGRSYPVAIRARMVAPYFLRLSDPVVLWSRGRRRALESIS